MSQKFINPFKFARLVIYPGIEVRKDTVVNVNSKFTFRFDIFKKFYINRILSKIAHLDFQDLRRIKTLYGVPVSMSLESTALEITNNIITDTFVVIRNLTNCKSPMRLLESIKFNVTNLPKLVYRIVNLINNCYLTTEMIGTESSIFNFVTNEVIFKDSNLDSIVTHKPEYTMGTVNKLNEAYSILKLDEILNINNLNDLYFDSDDLFNINTNKVEDGMILEVGKGIDEDDVLIGILCNPEYRFSNKDVILSQLTKISNTQLNDILLIPIESLKDPTINNVATKKLVNDYINSKIPTRIGEEPIQKGFIKDVGYNQQTETKFIIPKDLKPRKKSRAAKELDKLDDFNGEIKKDDE